MKMFFSSNSSPDSPTNRARVVFNGAFTDKDNFSPLIQTPMLSSRSKILPLSFLSTFPEGLFARFDELKRVAEDLIYCCVPRGFFSLLFARSLMSRNGRLSTIPSTTLRAVWVISVGRPERDLSWAWPLLITSRTVDLGTPVILAILPYPKSVAL